MSRSLKREREDNHRDSFPHKRGDRISSDIMEILLLLSTKIQAFNGVELGVCDIPHRHDIIEALNVVSNIIPRIVVWGDQSAGKSSFLNSIFGSANHTSAEIGTRCPIMFDFRKKHKESRFYITTNDGVTEYPSLEDAEKDVISASPDGILTGIYITCEIPLESGNEDFNVVDLPGFTNSSDLEYYTWLKNTYLDKEESIILHVTKADTDPKNAHSFNFLSGVKGKIVKVITHVDNFQTNADKKGYVNRYREQSDEKVVCLTITTNLENEVEQIKSHDVAQPQDKIGRDDIWEYIRTKLYERTAERLPTIKSYIKGAKECIDQALDVIHRISPDMRDCKHDFQREFETMISSANGEGGWITTTVRNITNAIDMTDFECLGQSAPSIDEIQNKIQFGSKVNLKGTEGYGHVISGIHEELLGKLAPILTHSINEAFESFAQQYHHNTVTPTPYSNMAIDDVGQYVMEEIEKAKKDVNCEINNYIKQKKDNPICNDESVYEDQFRHTIEEIVTLTLRHIGQYKNIAGTLKSDDVSHRIIDDIMTIKMQNDPYGYRMKAESARKFALEYWYSECNRIKQIISEKVSDAIQDMIRNVKAKYWSIDLDLFREDPIVDRVRKQLLEIEEIISRILDLTNDK
jgi:GTP-binding protein EngB required for normal cell division